MLEQIKQRLGIFYSDPLKDSEIQSMIDEAKSFMENAGWPATLLDDSLAVGAITLYCKMSQQTDPSQMQMNPVFVAMLAQARAKVVA